MKKIFISLILMGVLGFSQFFAVDDTEQIMEDRSANFKLMKKSSKNIKDILKSGKLDANGLTKAGNQINKSAKLITSYFPESTKGAIDSEAKEHIWDNFADYEKKAEDLSEKAINFVNVVKSNDTKKISAAFSEIGQSCKACHKEYRE